MFHGKFTIKTRLASSKVNSRHKQLQTFELSIFGIREAILVFYIVNVRAILCSCGASRVFSEFTIPNLWRD